MGRSRKWFISIGLLILIVVLGMGMYARIVTNPGVIDDLRTDPEGGRSDIVMILKMPDGQEYPVNYLREDNLVFIGIDGTWWRDFRDEGLAVALEIKGQILHGHGRVVLDDPGYTQAVFKRLRPTVPKWLPDWLNGKLVVINLAGSRVDE